MAEEAVSPLWTAEEVRDATGGRLHGADFRAGGVIFDSREARAGDLFVALNGARDGHGFADAAFAGGAVGALVSRPIDCGPFVLVEDTQVALERLAAVARDRSGARRAAVTGSVGKTSVTQATLAALRLAGDAHGPAKSFNNHIGVPLTLARMPRATRRAVFELGMNHPGEILGLTRMVRPHVAAITTVGPVHTENFADGEAGVARAKAEILAGLTPDGCAVLNADDRWFAELRTQAAQVDARVVAFGSDIACEARLTGVETRDDGMTVRATLFGRPVAIVLRQRGTHWALNSLCVLLLLDGLGVELAVACEALANFEPLAGRGAERTLRTAGGDVTLIDDSYNANPVSVAAALDTLGRREGRRIAVLTDMLELGSEGVRRHADLAQAVAAAGVDLVFAAGPQMRALYDALPTAARGAWRPDAATLAPLVVEAILPGDVVMVKGSNGSHASVVARALARMDCAL